MTMANTKRNKTTIDNIEEHRPARDESVQEVRFGVTKNMGNFESERIDVTIAREDGESFDSMVKRARTLCYRGLGDFKARQRKNRLREALREKGVKLDAQLEELIDADPDDDDIPFG